MAKAGKIKPTNGTKIAGKYAAVIINFYILIKLITYNYIYKI
jgi:hypothetical protein